MQLNELIYKTLRTSAALSCIALIVFLFGARWFGYISPSALIFYVTPTLAWVWISLDIAAKVKELNQ